MLAYHTFRGIQTVVVLTKGVLMARSRRRLLAGRSSRKRGFGSSPRAIPAWASFELLEQRQVLATDVNVSVGLGITQVDSSVHGCDERIVKQGDGTLVLSAANTHTGGVVVSSGTLVVRNVAALGSGPVVVQAGATLVLDDGSGTVEATSLVLQEGGLIDVGSSKLSIHTGFTQELLISAIQSAKGDGSWNGESGIGSSVVRSLSEDGAPRTLGWLTWVANDDSSYTVGFAAAGDTNLDGFVDVIDLSNIFNGANLDPGLTATWEAGDFNHDGIVDTLDLSDLMVTNLFDAGNYLPPEPPSVPTDLVATATSSTTATLTWANEDAPVGFEIEQSSDGVSGWQAVTLVSITDAGNGNTAAIVGGLSPGTATHFRVRGYNDSPLWWWDDRYRSADTATMIPAAPADVNARGVTPTQIVVSWTPGPGDRTGFVVQRQAAGQTTWTPLEPTSGTQRHFVDGTVTVGESYVYRVAAKYGTNTSDAVLPVVGAISPPESPPAATTDFDADGLPDLMELNIGTNPDAQDSDGDTLLDAYEYGTANNLLDPIMPNDANGDADGDGVPNRVEQAFMTNAGLADSDGDGVPDNQEIKRGSDPTDDSDGNWKPMSPATPPVWSTEVSFSEDFGTTAVLGSPQSSRSRLVILPREISLPARIYVVWSVDDSLRVNGAALGQSAIRAGEESAGVDIVTVSTRWMTIEVLDPDDTDANGTVSLTYLSVDLDVDSDNNDHLAVPERSSNEEFVEETSPKKVIVDSYDADHDHWPDFADMWWCGGKSFTPVVVQIPNAIPVSEMTVTFNYDASDPDAVSIIDPVSLPKDGGPIRVWTKNASDVRSPLSVPQHYDPLSTRGPGDFVRPKVDYDAASLGFSELARTLVFYVEGVRLSKDPISITIDVSANGMDVGGDTAILSVISNFLVIGIDGSDQSTWLNGPNATRPNGLWNSHVRNLVEDVKPYAMTIYNIGPNRNGTDCAKIENEVVEEANQYIEEAGGDTIVAIVGWSRGGMIALWAANDLVGMPGEMPPTATRQVAFVGLYDPVDMSAQIDGGAASIQPGIGRVTIVGPATTPNNNVDWPVGWPTGWNDVPFWRMAQNNRITAIGNATIVERYFYNASHGAIGGTPGFNGQLVSIPDGGYDYAIDRERSILSDKNIRDGMRAAGFDFIPDRDEEWYGIPSARPVIAPDE